MTDGAPRNGAPPDPAAVVSPDAAHPASAPVSVATSTLDALSPAAVRAALLSALDDAVDFGARIREVADGTHPGVLADAIADLPVQTMRQVLTALGAERLADVVAETDLATAVDVLQWLPQPEAADVLEAMDPDDAADVVGELRDEDAPAAERLLQEMEQEEAEDVRQLLSYPEDSAGGIMTTDFLAVPATDSVEEVTRRVRAPDADEIPEESTSYVYVTEPSGQLVGVVPWHRLLRAGARVPVRALTSSHTISVPARADQETVARVVREHRLLAVPVVDDAGRLLGIVTADDIADVVEEETTEDIERLGGSQPLDEPYLRAGPLTLARKRVVWLLLLFLGATYTSTVLQYFQEQLDTVVALA
ncbi:MAG: CBS domain-containing protein, partial [Chloroflexota bacterium]|nr:CBS domain-containing protein [Chloroflexota bacterium]